VEQEVLKPLHFGSVAFLESPVTTFKYDVEILFVKDEVAFRRQHALLSHVVRVRFGFVTMPCLPANFSLTFPATQPRMDPDVRLLAKRVAGQASRERQDIAQHRDPPLHGMHLLEAPLGVRPS
jgi:hypothetical protein